MTKQQLFELFNHKIVILDGATGSNLMLAGMEVGACPEQWILEHPDALLNLQKSYLQNGSDIILAPTFTGNRIKLAEYGLEERIVEINTKLVSLSKRAVEESGTVAYVAGDLTMTGRQLEPIGDMPLEELIDVYKQQATILASAGVDLFIVETMMSLEECRAAVLAIKEVCDLPVIVSLSYNEDGRTLFGATPEASVVVLQSLGVDAVGINCSTGPKEMLPHVKKMLSYAKVPVFVKPNNGIPELVDGVSTYSLSMDEFCFSAKLLLESGIRGIGGCCGTTPAHIKALSELVQNANIIPFKPVEVNALASLNYVTDIDLDGPFLVVGERINPTGKKKLQESLKEGNLDLVIQMAEEQTACGASVLDINMGMNGIDEDAMMQKAIQSVLGVTHLPLCIDSSHVNIIEHALRIYPGRALINSVSLEEVKCRPLMKIAAKYGAMCILLPLSDKGLPETLEEKIDNINRLLAIAKEEGVPRENLVIDGLVATVGANKKAAIETLQTIEYCKNQLKIPTICGLSNISFGLPERIHVNTAFLTMAISKGLTMAICNPNQAMLMNAAFASDLLLAKQNSSDRYVENVLAVSTDIQNNTQKNSSEIVGSAVFVDVVKGKKDIIEEDVKAALERGQSAQNIIDNDLIPAVNKVGELFEQKKYYLPQLISGATAMDTAINYLTPFLNVDETSAKKGTVVMATVEGDIHDIGKNLVVLMLKNYGYRVIDLGKDVQASAIIEAAIREKADIIGLSALMTTTMMRMKEVVNLVREQKLPFKVIIGGAVVSSSFADEIGADGYSKDANEAVKLVDRLLTYE